MKLAITTDKGRVDDAMRLDFDFDGHGGYAIARYTGVLELPENFELSFWMKADAPRNTLEVKFIDESGENVWWSTRRDFEFPREWRRIAVRKRNIEFAWGPAGAGPLPKKIGSIEIVVTAGTGGKGTVWIDDPMLSPLETVSGPPPSPVRNGGTIDLVRRRELGGLTIDWAENPVDYSVATSIDGENWETTRVTGSNGGRDPIYLPDGDARWIRIEPATFRDVVVHDADWSRTPNDFFASIAKDAPRGDWPRYLRGEMSYWTILGADGNPVEALISEDGAIEAGDARFSIEPFLVVNGRLLTWNDVQRKQSLLQGELPIPTVEWMGKAKLSVTAFVAGDERSSTLYVRYRTGGAERLHLAIRPLQVNTPWQFLKRLGGVVPIKSIAFDGTQATVDADQRGVVVPLTKPSSFFATSFHGGNIVELLRGKPPATQSIVDPFGYASAAFTFTQNDVVIAVPLNAGAKVGTNVDELLAQTAKSWTTKLGRVTIDVPAAPQLVRSIRSNLAYIGINRDGPSIQPGSRSYDRSWIRDGSLTSTALLRLGDREPVREFILWYAKHVYADGNVPCCVSAAGADPVPEHDSHGQFIYLVAEYYRHTKDRALVEQLWPKIEAVVSYIDELRHQRMTDAYRDTAFWGLVPESISHEGYSAKAMHSYWDDFFILRGLKDATELATMLGKDSTRYAAMRDEFRRDLMTSIARAMKERGIDYIPGSVELGDFDATSTTVALSPVDEEANLPRAALVRTFEKYMENFRGRRDGTLASEIYTPYEWRVVGSLLRLGKIDEAHEVLRWFFLDQRPSEWNHWSEAIWKDPRHGGFIGDMPHTWVGSDFIRSTLDLFVYEKGDQLILGAGVLPAWIAQGVRIEGLSTEWGEISYTLRRVNGKVELKMLKTPKPPGGIVEAYPR